MARADVDSINDYQRYAADDLAYRLAERFGEVGDEDSHEDDVRKVMRKIPLCSSTGKSFGSSASGQTR